MLFRSVPVVSFACPCGPKDIVKDGKNGLLVVENDYYDLAEKINYLITNDKERIQMGKYAKLSVHNYTIDIIMKQWVALFENSLNGKF